jgi:hypothetical protein
MEMTKATVFVSCCLLVVTAAAARSLAADGENFGGRKDYYPPGPADPQHSPNPTPCNRAYITPI